MPNKSIPSEVAQGLVDVAKDTVSEFVEKGILGNTDDPAQQKPTPSQSQTDNDKKIQDLVKKDQEEKQKGIPDVSRILKQQETEREFIDAEKQRKQNEEIQEAEQTQLAKMREEEERSLQEDSLAATGHKMTARDRFSRIGTKESSKKQGM